MDLIMRDYDSKFTLLTKRVAQFVLDPFLTEGRALAELKCRMPRSEVRMVNYGGGVKIYSGTMLMTNRRTLREAMRLVRKYCPVPAKA